MTDQLKTADYFPNLELNIPMDKQSTHDLLLLKRNVQQATEKKVYQWNISVQMLHAFLNIQTGVVWDELKNNCTDVGRLLCYSRAEP